MPEPLYRDQFEAIGTTWTIELYDTYTATKLARLQRAIRQRIEQFDKTYSRFRSDSAVSVMAGRDGSYRLPDDAEALLSFYRQLYNLTDGAVTPLIGQVLSDAGYNAQYSLQPGGKLSVPPAWDEIIDYRFPELHLTRPALLDFGAAGKGYLVDIIGAVLEDYGSKTFCIDAGGDILYRSDSGQGIRIGLEHPGDPSLAIGLATIHNQSLCGSAGNRRAWGNYHHIIDPHLLTSPRHIQAVWVIAATGLLADGLTTALFFTPARQLAKAFRFEYVIMHADDTLETSAHFPAEFYTALSLTDTSNNKESI